MSIYVACHCGQAFHARADLAGQTTVCPRCHQPLTVPAGVNPAAQLVAPPVGHKLLPAPPPASPVAGKHASGRKKSVSTRVLLAGGAAGVVLASIIGLITVQQLAGGVEPASQPAVKPAVAPTDSPPTAENSAAGNRGSAKPKPTERELPSAVTLAGIPENLMPQREDWGWSRVGFGEGRYSVAMPGEAEEMVSAEDGYLHRELRLADPKHRQVLKAGAYYGGVGSLDARSFTGSRIDNLQRAARQTNPPGQITRTEIDGREAVQVVLNNSGHHARHVFILTGEKECVICSATTEGDQLTRDEVDRFIESIKLNHSLPAKDDLTRQESEWSYTSASSMPLRSLKASVKMPPRSSRRNTSGNVLEAYEFKPLANGAGGLLSLEVRQIGGQPRDNRESEHLKAHRAADGSVEIRGAHVSYFPTLEIQAKAPGHFMRRQLICAA
jgi:hypothetical protein